VDYNQTFFYVVAVTYRWCMFNLDGIANLVVFFAAIFELTSPSTSGGGLGLSVSYALQVGESHTL
jgi:hypothetical protein